MSAPKLTQTEMRELMERAERAGSEAVTAMTPTPMVVGSPRDPMASLMGDESAGLDPAQPQYVVPDGVCGFAWVNVKPGGSRFARWLKETGRGRSDSYYGGVTIWISDYRQSYERKMAHAQAMAGVLREAGIKATASGRLD